VIITNGGGIGVMATDASEKYGVPLYDNMVTLKEIFSPVTPEFGSMKNPVDITGQAQSDHYDAALDAALNCEDIHAVVALYCETAVFDAEKLPAMVKNNYERFRNARKPILFSLFGGENTERCVTELSREQVPVYGDVYESVSPLGAMYAYRRHLAHYVEAVDTVALDVNAINAIIAGARNEERYFLLTNEAQEIMKIAHIPIPRTLIARSLNEAVNSSREIEYPVVMKVVSKDIIHKSDAGGVALDLENEKEVIDAYEAIMRSCKAHVPGAHIEGVEITEMVSAGTELIAGAKIDPSFGPIVMVGLGGIYVEVMKDVAFRAYPLNRSEVLSMIEQIRSYPLLLGVRGEKTKDISSLVDIILRLGSIVEQCRGISDIEINPVMVYDQGMGSKAVDVRILLSKDQ
ncbi:MAG: acetate--CoA ligase family protein, partial [Deltaproteobacteria bacterium]|nr:acetate--CoA ligase family protein [Deltaproteobacteria bacterium]